MELSWEQFREEELFSNPRYVRSCLLQLKLEQLGEVGSLQLAADSANSTAAPTNSDKLDLEYTLGNSEIQFSTKLPREVMREWAKEYTKGEKHAINYLASVATDQSVEDMVQHRTSLVQRMATAHNKLKQQHKSNTSTSSNAHTDDLHENLQEKMQQPSPMCNYVIELAKPLFTEAGNCKGAAWLTSNHRSMLVHVLETIVSTLTSDTGSQQVATDFKTVQHFIQVQTIDWMANDNANDEILTSLLLNTIVRLGAIRSSVNGILSAMVTLVQLSSVWGESNGFKVDWTKANEALIERNTENANQIISCQTQNISLAAYVTEFLSKVVANELCPHSHNVNMVNDSHQTFPKVIGNWEPIEVPGLQVGTLFRNQVSNQMRGYQPIDPLLLNLKFDSIDVTKPPSSTVSINLKVPHQTGKANEKKPCAQIVPLYYEPSFKSRVGTIAKSNSQLLVTGKRGDWYRVHVLSTTTKNQVSLSTWSSVTASGTLPSDATSEPRSRVESAISVDSSVTHDDFELHEENDALDSPYATIQHSSIRVPYHELESIASGDSDSATSVPASNITHAKVASLGPPLWIQCDRASRAGLGLATPIQNCKSIVLDQHALDEIYPNVSRTQSKTGQNTSETVTLLATMLQFACGTQKRKVCGHIRAPTSSLHSKSGESSCYTLSALGLLQRSLPRHANQLTNEARNDAASILESIASTNAFHDQASGNEYCGTCSKTISLDATSVLLDALPVLYPTTELLRSFLLRITPAHHSETRSIFEQIASSLTLHTRQAQNNCEESQRFIPATKSDSGSHPKIHPVASILHDLDLSAPESRRLISALLKLATENALAQLEVEVPTQQQVEQNPKNSSQRNNVAVLNASLQILVVIQRGIICSLYQAAKDTDGCGHHTNSSKSVSGVAWYFQTMAESARSIINFARLNLEVATQEENSNSEKMPSYSAVRANMVGETLSNSVLSALLPTLTLAGISTLQSWAPAGSLEASNTLSSYSKCISASFAFLQAAERCCASGGTTNLGWVVQSLQVNAKLVVVLLQGISPGHPETPSLGQHRHLTPHLKHLIQAITSINSSVTHISKKQIDFSTTSFFQQLLKEEGDATNWATALFEGKSPSFKCCVTLLPKGSVMKTAVMKASLAALAALLSLNPKATDCAIRQVQLMTNCAKQGSLIPLSEQSVELLLPIFKAASKTGKWVLKTGQALKKWEEAIETVCTSAQEDKNGNELEENLQSSIELHSKKLQTSVIREIAKVKGIFTSSHHRGAANAVQELQSDFILLMRSEAEDRLKNTEKNSSVQHCQLLNPYETASRIIVARSKACVEIALLSLFETVEPRIKDRRLRRVKSWTGVTHCATFEMNEQLLRRNSAPSKFVHPTTKLSRQPEHFTFDEDHEVSVKRTPLLKRRHSFSQQRITSSLARVMASHSDQNAPVPSPSNAATATFPETPPSSPQKRSFELRQAQQPEGWRRYASWKSKHASVESSTVLHNLTSNLTSEQENETVLQFLTINPSSSVLGDLSSHALNVESDALELRTLWLKLESDALYTLSALRDARRVLMSAKLSNAIAASSFKISSEIFEALTAKTDTTCGTVTGCIHSLRGCIPQAAITREIHDILGQVCLQALENCKAVEATLNQGAKLSDSTIASDISLKIEVGMFEARTLDFINKTGLLSCATCSYAMPRCLLDETLSLAMILLKERVKTSGLTSQETLQGAGRVLYNDSQPFYQARFKVACCTIHTIFGAMTDDDAHVGKSIFHSMMDVISNLVEVEQRFHHVYLDHEPLLIVLFDILIQTVQQPGVVSLVQNNQLLEMYFDKFQAAFNFADQCNFVRLNFVITECFRIVFTRDSRNPDVQFRPEIEDKAAKLLLLRLNSALQCKLIAEPTCGTLETKLKQFPKDRVGMLWKHNQDQLPSTTHLIATLPLDLEGGCAIQLGSQSVVCNGTEVSGSLLSIIPGEFEVKISIRMNASPKPVLGGELEPHIPKRTKKVVTCMKVSGREIELPSESGTNNVALLNAVVVHQVTGEVLHVGQYSFVPTQSSTCSVEFVGSLLRLIHKLPQDRVVALSCISPSLSLFLSDGVVKSALQTLGARKVASLEPTDSAWAFIGTKSSSCEPVEHVLGTTRLNKDCLEVKRNTHYFASETYDVSSSMQVQHPLAEQKRDDQDDANDSESDDSTTGYLNWNGTNQYSETVESDEQTPVQNKLRRLSKLAQHHDSMMLSSLEETVFSTKHGCQHCRSLCPVRSEEGERNRHATCDCGRQNQAFRSSPRSLWLHLSNDGPQSKTVSVVVHRRCSWTSQRGTTEYSKQVRLEAGERTVVLVSKQPSSQGLWGDIQIDLHTVDSKDVSTRSSSDDVSFGAGISSESLVRPLWANPSCADIRAWLKYRELSKSDEATTNILRPKLHGVWIYEPTSTCATGSLLDCPATSEESRSLAALNLSLGIHRAMSVTSLQTGASVVETFKQLLPAQDSSNGRRVFIMSGFRSVCERAATALSSCGLLCTVEQMDESLPEFQTKVLQHQTRCDMDVNLSYVMSNSYTNIDGNVSYKFSQLKCEQLVRTRESYRKVSNQLVRTIQELIVASVPLGKALGKQLISLLQLDDEYLPLVSLTGITGAHGGPVQMDDFVIVTPTAADINLSTQPSRTIVAQSHYSPFMSSNKCIQDDSWMSIPSYPLGSCGKLSTLGKVVAIAHSKELMYVELVQAKSTDSSKAQYLAVPYKRLRQVTGQHSTEVINKITETSGLAGLVRGIATLMNRWISTATESGDSKLEAHEFWNQIQQGTKCLISIQQAGGTLEELQEFPQLLHFLHNCVENPNECWTAEEVDTIVHWIEARSFNLSVLSDTLPSPIESYPSSQGELKQAEELKESSNNASHRVGVVPQSFSPEESWCTVLEDDQNGKLLTAQYTGLKHRVNHPLRPIVDGCVVRSERPIHPALDTYYFEVTVLDQGKLDGGGIDVGLWSQGTPGSHIDGMAQWGEGSYYYNGQDGSRCWWVHDDEMLTRVEYKVGVLVDVKDFHPPRTWRPATITAKEKVGAQERVKVHYLGWEERWDEWIPCNSPRIAPILSKSATRERYTGAQHDLETFEKRLTGYIRKQDFGPAFISSKTDSGKDGNDKTNGGAASRAVIGCGYNQDKGNIFFTLNGILCGTAFTGVQGVFFPAIFIGNQGARVRVNFGTDSRKPFLWQGKLSSAVAATSPSSTDRSENNDKEENRIDTQWKASRTISREVEQRIQTQESRVVLKGTLRGNPTLVCCPCWCDEKCCFNGVEESPYCRSHLKVKGTDSPALKLSHLIATALNTSTWDMKQLSQGVQLMSTNSCMLQDNPTAIDSIRAVVFPNIVKCGADGLATLELVAKLELQRNILVLIMERDTVHEFVLGLAKTLLGDNQLVLIVDAIHYNNLITILDETNATLTLDVSIQGSSSSTSIAHSTSASARQDVSGNWGAYLKQHSAQQTKGVRLLQRDPSIESSDSNCTSELLDMNAMLLNRGNTEGCLDGMLPVHQPRLNNEVNNLATETTNFEAMERIFEGVLQQHTVNQSSQQSATQVANEDNEIVTISCGTHGVTARYNTITGEVELPIRQDGTRAMSRGHVATAISEANRVWMDRVQQEVSNDAILDLIDGSLESILDNEESLSFVAGPQPWLSTSEGCTKIAMDAQSPPLAPESSPKERSVTSNDEENTPVDTKYKRVDAIEEDSLDNLSCRTAERLAGRIVEVNITVDTLQKYHEACEADISEQYTSGKLSILAQSNGGSSPTRISRSPTNRRQVELDLDDLSSVANIRNMQYIAAELDNTIQELDNAMMGLSSLQEESEQLHRQVLQSEAEQMGLYDTLVVEGRQISNRGTSTQQTSTDFSSNTSHRNDTSSGANRAAWNRRAFIAPTSTQTIFELESEFYNLQAGGTQSLNDFTQGQSSSATSNNGNRTQAWGSDESNLVNGSSIVLPPNQGLNLPQRLRYVTQANSVTQVTSPSQQQQQQQQQQPPPTRSSTSIQTVQSTTAATTRTSSGSQTPLGSQQVLTSGVFGSSDAEDVEENRFDSLLRNIDIASGALGTLSGVLDPSQQSEGTQIRNVGQSTELDASDLETEASSSSRALLDNLFNGTGRNIFGAFRRLLMHSKGNRDRKNNQNKSIPKLQGAWFHDMDHLATRRSRGATRSRGTIITLDLSRSLALVAFPLETHYNVVEQYWLPFTCLTLLPAPVHLVPNPTNSSNTKSVSLPGLKVPSWHTAPLVMAKKQSVSANAASLLSCLSIHVPTAFPCVLIQDGDVKQTGTGKQDGTVHQNQLSAIGNIVGVDLFGNKNSSLGQHILFAGSQNIRQVVREKVLEQDHVHGSQRLRIFDNFTELILPTSKKEEISSTFEHVKFIQSLVEQSVHFMTEQTVEVSVASLFESDPKYSRVLKNPAWAKRGSQSKGTSNPLEMTPKSITDKLDLGKQTSCLVISFGKSIEGKPRPVVSPTNQGLDSQPCRNGPRLRISRRSHNRDRVAGDTIRDVWPLPPHPEDPQPGGSHYGKRKRALLWEDGLKERVPLVVDYDMAKGGLCMNVTLNKGDLDMDLIHQQNPHHKLALGLPGRVSITAVPCSFYLACHSLRTLTKWVVGKPESKSGNEARESIQRMIIFLIETCLAGKLPDPIHSNVLQLVTYIIQQLGSTMQLDNNTNVVQHIRQQLFALYSSDKRLRGIQNSNEPSQARGFSKLFHSYAELLATIHIAPSRSTIPSNGTVPIFSLEEELDGTFLTRKQMETCFRMSNEAMEACFPENQHDDLDVLSQSRRVSRKPSELCSWWVGYMQFCQVASCLASGSNLPTWFLRNAWEDCVEKIAGERHEPSEEPEPCGYDDTLAMVHSLAKQCGGLWDLNADAQLAEWIDERCSGTTTDVVVQATETVSDETDTSFNRAESLASTSTSSAGTSMDGDSGSGRQLSVSRRVVSSPRNRATSCHFDPTEISSDAIHGAALRYRRLKVVRSQAAQCGVSFETAFKLRVLVLQEYNRMYKANIAMVDMSRHRILDSWSIPACIARCRTSVFHDVAVEGVQCLVTGSASSNIVDRPSISIDRWKAPGSGEGTRLLRYTYSADGSIVTDLPIVEADGGLSSLLDGNDDESETMFEQARRQLCRVPPHRLRQQYITPHLCFEVSFPKEKVAGEAGPYRQFFSDICAELQDPNANTTRCNVPLLIPSPNQQLGVGEVRDLFVVRPSATSSVSLERFHFFGRLLGIAIRTKILLPLKIPPLFWKQLTDSPSEVKDLEQVDNGFVTGVLNGLKMCDDKENFDATFGDSLTYSTTLSDGIESKLPQPNGTDDRVYFEHRMYYYEQASKRRLEESSLQMVAIRQGLEEIVPSRLLNTISWRSLELTVCGRPHIDVDMLRRHTSYAGVSKFAPHIEYLWQVLKEFSHEDRTRFVRFAWAQDRLPASDKEFDTLGVRMLVKGSGNKYRDPDQALPRADTCFFNIEIPAYSSLEIMRERLSTAINMDFGLEGDDALL